MQPTLVFCSLMCHSNWLHKQSWILWLGSFFSVLRLRVQHRPRSSPGGECQVSAGCKAAWLTGGSADCNEPWRRRWKERRGELERGRKSSDMQRWIRMLESHRGHPITFQERLLKYVVICLIHTSFFCHDKWMTMHWSFLDGSPLRSISRLHRWLWRDRRK